MNFMKKSQYKVWDEVVEGDRFLTMSDEETVSVSGADNGPCGGPLRPAPRKVCKVWPGTKYVWCKTV